ncbi:hypothetical protein Peur_044033 [Populus x canadensis]
MTCNDRNHPSSLLNSHFLTNKSSLHTDFQCSYSFSLIASSIFRILAIYYD